MLEQQPAHFVLAARLTRLRGQAGLPIRTAASAARVSPTTIARIESAQVVPRRSTVESLLTQYGVVEPRHREYLLGLLGEERLSCWFDVADIPIWLASVLALEDQASHLMAYCPNFLSPFLQTPAYARAAVEASRRPGATPEQISDGVELIMSRQQTLERADKPTLWAVIDLKALLDPPLTHLDDRLEQLDALIAAARQPHIVIQVTRPTSHTRFMPDAPRFTILRFPEPGRSDLLQLHLLHGPGLIDDPTVVEHHHMALASLYCRAFTPTDTIEILKQIRASTSADPDPFGPFATPRS